MTDLKRVYTFVIDEMPDAYFEGNGRPYFTGDPTSDVDASVTSSDLIKAVLEHCRTSRVQNESEVCYL